MDFDFEKIKPIKMLVMDVDGIMTDSRIMLDANGEWKRFFSVRDGLGILSVRNAGYTTAVITGANSVDVRKRMEHLKIHHFFENKSDKIPAFEDLKIRTGFEDKEICYIGDDLPDLPLLMAAGFAVTVPEAVEDVRKECDYITAKQGGYGAVRELCDLIVRNGSHRKL